MLINIFGEAGKEKEIPRKEGLIQRKKRLEKESLEREYQEKERQKRERFAQVYIVVSGLLSTLLRNAVNLFPTTPINSTQNFSQVQSNIEQISTPLINLGSGSFIFFLIFILIYVLFLEKIEITSEDKQLTYEEIYTYAVAILASLFLSLQFTSSFVLQMIINTGNNLPHSWPAELILIIAIPALAILIASTLIPSKYMIQTSIWATLIYMLLLFVVSKNILLFLFIWYLIAIVIFNDLMPALGKNIFDTPPSSGYKIRKTNKITFLFAIELCYLGYLIQNIWILCLPTFVMAINLIVWLADYE